MMLMLRTLRYQLVTRDKVMVGSEYQAIKYPHVSTIYPFHQNVAGEISPLESAWASRATTCRDPPQVGTTAMSPRLWFGTGPPAAWWFQAAVSYVVKLCQAQHMAITAVNHRFRISHVSRRIAVEMALCDGLDEWPRVML